jgi:hypothetical protein
MKVKLLKKIRKRFDWYLRKTDKVPVVLDLREKTLYMFTNETIVVTGKYKDEESMLKSIEIPMEEFRWRMAKDFMYKNFGYKIADALFREAIRYGVGYKNRRKL